LTASPSLQGGFPGRFSALTVVDCPVFLKKVAISMADSEEEQSNDRNYQENQPEEDERVSLGADIDRVEAEGRPQGRGRGKELYS